MVKGGRELGVLRDNLEWIIRYAEGIEEYRTYFGDDFETFADTEVYQDACYSKINQITQCLDRVASKYPEFYTQNFSMRIGSIKGIRNIISHQYENVDVRIVWRFMTEEIPVWESDARSALMRIDDGGDHSLKSPATKRKGFRELFRKHRPSVPSAPNGFHP